METDHVSWKYPTYCRICFTCVPEMLDLVSFLPVIRLIAQTKIPCDDERTSKICSSCANCLILANLFRVKVIESNGRYREFLEMECVKQEQVLEEEKQTSIESPPPPEEMREESMAYDDQMSDDEMQVEFLNEFFNAVDEKEAAETIQFVKAPPRKIVKQASPLLKQEKSRTKRKIEISPNEMEEEHSSKPVCFICLEPALKKHLLSPFKSTLNRIVSVRNCKNLEYLCQKCSKKLEDSKIFFERMDKVKTPTAKKDCCQFCLNKVTQKGETPKNTLQIFSSLHKSGHESRAREDGKTCVQCVQSLNRIRMVKNSYNAKERYFEKKEGGRRRSAPNTTAKKQKVMPAVCHEEFEALCSDESVPAITITTPRRKARRLRIRAKPKYVEPDPNESLPEDYQCHMSDFEEIESDIEVPAVPFRSPLNVPFKHKYLHCPDCNYKFVNTYEMETHYDIVHRTTSEVCDICNKAFKDVKTVRDHKFSVHTTDFSAFNFRKLCDICGLAKRKFENHYAIHFDVRAFKCKLCSCDYKTKASLEDHVRTVHLGEKRHKCAYCDKRFGYAADKARHEIGVHTKKFKHICQFCGKCFLKKNFMTGHQKAQHAEMLLEIKDEAEAQE